MTHTMRTERDTFGEIEVPYEVATSAQGLRQALLSRRAP